MCAVPREMLCPNPSGPKSPSGTPSGCVEGAGSFHMRSQASGLPPCEGSGCGRSRGMRLISLMSPEDTSVLVRGITVLQEGKTESPHRGTDRHTHTHRHTPKVILSHTPERGHRQRAREPESQRARKRERERETGTHSHLSGRGRTRESERASERERETDTHRHTHRHTDTPTHTHLSGDSAVDAEDRVADDSYTHSHRETDSETSETATHTDTHRQSFALPHTHTPERGCRRGRRR
eukprot:1547221-Rhodomonas_salina.1